jgi:hypothetical protein
MFYKEKSGIPDTNNGRKSGQVSETGIVRIVGSEKFEVSRVQDFFKSNGLLRWTLWASLTSVCIFLLVKAIY